MFRVIEAAKPSLLIDEADSFAHENEELRGVINASHCRLDAFVVRAVPAGDDYEARQFSTWAPMAIASIGKVAATIADRSIMIGWSARRRGRRWPGCAPTATTASACSPARPRAGSPTTSRRCARPTPMCRGH